MYRICPEMLRVFWYRDVLTCVIYNCMHLNEKHGQLELLIVCCEDYRRRQVGECADTWHKWIQPTESGAVSAWQLANASV